MYYGYILDTESLLLHIVGFKFILCEYASIKMTAGQGANCGLDIYWLYLTFESNIKSKKVWQYKSHKLEFVPK